MGKEKRSDDLVKKLPFFILTLSALILVTLVVFWNNEAQRIRLAPSPELLINYPLDSLSSIGQTPDLVSGSNATTQGTTLTEGMTGRAVYIRGGTIDTGLDVDLKGDFTLNLWVKPTTTNGRQKLVAKEFFGVVNSSYSLFLHNGFLRFEFFNSSQSFDYVSLASPSTIPANEWTMITITLGQDLSMYVNGKFEKGVTGITSRPVDRDISLLIGSTRNGSSITTPTYIDNFDGSIDDVRIYNRALSETEIITTYQQSQSNLIRVYYDFNSISGSQVSDSSSYGLSGSLSGGPSTVRGIRGTNSLLFDGQDDYVTAPHAGQLDLMGGTFTLSGWIRTQSKATSIILEKNGAGTGPSFRNYGLYLNATGSFHFFAKCNAAQDIGTTQSLNDGNWHHVVAVRDGQSDKRYLYIDGALVLTADDSDPACDDFSSSSPLYIGARFSGSPTSNFFFNGSLDNVAVYTRALSSSEIRNVYQEHNNYSLLRMSYGFNSLSNNQAIDDSDYQLSNTVGGNPSLVNGKEGSNALSLNGDDYVNVTNNQALNLTKSYSLSSLVKTTSQTTQIILEKNDIPSNPNGRNYGLYLNATGSFHFFAKCNAAQDIGTTQSLNDGNWHHVVAVRDGQSDKRYLYIDGALVLTADDTQCDDFSSQAPLYIGARFESTGKFFFNGTIDRTEVYTRVLTPVEINDEYEDLFDTSGSSSNTNPRRGGSSGGSGGGSITVTPITTNGTQTIPVEPTIYQPDTSTIDPTIDYTNSNDSSSNSMWFYIIISLLGLLILASLIGLGVLVLRSKKKSSSTGSSTPAAPANSSMPRPPFPPSMPQRPALPIQQRPPMPPMQAARPPQQTLSIQPNPGQRPR